MRLALAFVAACGTPHPKGAQMGRQDCRQAIAAFVHGDPATFRGLPDGCTAADVDLVAGSATGYLGEPTSSRTIRFVTDDIRAWFDGDRLVRVDREYPPAPSWQAYVAPLGEPEVKLPFRWTNLELPDVEWVWPSRGIVVAAKADPGVILRAGIFVPGTLADYRREARFVSQYRDED
jgi:hypothetical protein